MTALGRDLLTTAEGDARPLGEVHLDVRADFAEGTIERVHAEPSHPGLAALAGAPAFHGFRAHVDEVMPGERQAGTLRHQLLDDLPIALMLSARVLRAAGLGLGLRSPAGLPVDICAGWVTGGTLLAGMTEAGPPLHTGPAPSELRPPDDDVAWHQFSSLPPDATRRHRRLDVWPDGDMLAVDCFFRDSFANSHGVETVVHEYRVYGTVDPATSRIDSCHADPGPLPYPECPNAAASAGRLVGGAVDGLRQTVRDTFTGPSTCTHLNDTLRSLQDVMALQHALRDNTSRPS